MSDSYFCVRAVVNCGFSQQNHCAGLEVFSTVTYTVKKCEIYYSRFIQGVLTGTFMEAGCKYLAIINTFKPCPVEI